MDSLRKEEVVQAVLIADNFTNNFQPISKDGNVVSNRSSVQPVFHNEISSTTEFKMILLLGQLINCRVCCLW